MEIYKILLLLVWLYLIVSTVLSYKRNSLYLDDYGFIIKSYATLLLTVYFLHLITEQIDWSWLFIKV